MARLVIVVEIDTDPTEENPTEVAEVLLDLYDTGASLVSAEWADEQE